MLFVPQILVRAFVLGFCAVALQACGQQGPLYLPQAGNAHRATLPESLLPTADRTKKNAEQPAPGVSAPQNVQ